MLQSIRTSVNQVGSYHKDRRNNEPGRGSQLVSHNGLVLSSLLVAHHHAWMKHRRQDLALGSMSIRVSSASQFDSVLNVLLVILVQPLSY